MRRFLSWSLAIVAIASTVAPAVSTVAAQSESADAAARAEFEAGRDAYDRGRFDEALQHYDRAYALSSNPKMLFNIGRAAEADLQYERATRAYEAYLQALERAENREFVEGRLAKLREVSRQDVQAAPQPPPQSAAGSPTERRSGNKPLLAPFRIYAGLRLGAGGTVTDDWEGDETGSDSSDLDLKATPGLQLGAGYVWRYFGIGGELRFSSYKIDFGDDDVGIDRQKAIDVVVKPRGGYQFSNIPLEVYGAVPAGVSFLKGDLADEYKTDVGFTVGLFAGATYLFTKNIGLNAEIGWTMHSYDYAYEDDEAYEGSVTFQQFTPLVVNFVAAL